MYQYPSIIVVTEVLLRLALDVAAVGGSVEDVRQLADNIGAAFRRAAPTMQDMFNNLADDLEGVNRDNSSSSSSNSSEDEGPPPPKRQELDNRARFLEHNLLTGYSHPEDSTIPASEDSDDLTSIECHTVAIVPVVQSTE